MKAVCVRAALLLAIPFLAACEDGAGPEGEPSNFEVHVYVETDDSVGFDPDVEPGLEATVTLTSTFDDVVLVGQTGADGIVAFPDVAAGSYTVTHSLDGAADAIELRGSQTQTVVAPLAGADVVTRFVYEFANGAIGGVVFRDDNGSGAFEAGQDSVFEGVALELFEGAAPGELLAMGVSDENGAFEFDELPAGEYTLAIEPLPNMTVVGINPRTLSVEPGELLVANIELAGDPTGGVITIAEARDSAVDDTVKVRGTVTAGQGVYRADSFQLQDATSGIFVFGLIDESVILEEGDSVEVLAERWQFRREAWLTTISVVVLGTGEVPLPRAIDTDDLNAGLYQGELATLSATVDSIRPGDGGFQVWVHDAEGDAQIFVDNDTEIAAAEFTLNAAHSITGVIGTFDADDDLVIELGDYVLRPRAASDIVN